MSFNTLKAFLMSDETSIIFIFSWFIVFLWMFLPILFLFWYWNIFIHLWRKKIIHEHNWKWLLYLSIITCTSIYQEVSIFKSWWLQDFFNTFLLLLKLQSFHSYTRVFHTNSSLFTFYLQEVECIWCAKSMFLFVTNVLF